MTYKVKILSVLEYYRYITNIFDFRNLLHKTDSGYPMILALGWCLHSRKEIVICRLFNWKLRLWHELGHSVGLGHIEERGHVMHPWGILRGWKGKEEIERKLRN